MNAAPDQSRASVRWIDRVPIWAWAALVVIALAGAGSIGFLIGSPHQRPTANLVPGAPTTVAVAGYGPAPTGLSANQPYVPDAVATVTTRQAVARLVSDVNSMPLVSSGNRSCPFSDGSHYQLRFSYANGDRITVYAERQGCKFIGFDDASTVAVAWSLTDSRLLNDLDALSRRPQ